MWCWWISSWWWCVGKTHNSWWVSVHRIYIDYVEKSWSWLFQNPTHRMTPLQLLFNDWFSCDDSSNQLFISINDKGNNRRCTLIYTGLSHTRHIPHCHLMSMSCDDEPHSTKHRRSSVASCGVPAAKRVWKGTGTGDNHLSVDELKFTA